MSLVQDSQTQIPNLHRQLCVLELFKSWRPYPAFAATELVTCISQRAPNDQERLSAATDPNESHVILQANPRHLVETTRPSWRGQTPARAQTLLARLLNRAILLSSCRRRFSGQLVARRQHPDPPWVPRHVVHPSSYNAHYQCRRIRRAEHQVRGFNSFEEAVNVLLNHAAFSQLHEHLRQHNRAELT